MSSPVGLPVQLTTFVGRMAELAELTALTASARLVTLVGVGGAGKTRLAVEHAATLDEANRTVFVDLAAIDDAAQLVPMVAHALGADGVAIDDVVSSIGDERVLVVLDNCEHVLDDVAVLTDALLRRCPAVSVVATSREPLRVAGEVTYHIGPLAAAEAVRLFCDRAMLARPGIDLMTDDADAVADICRRLDGIPLALELVAARVRALSIEQLAHELRGSRRIGLGDRRAPARQQTIEGSIGWSHDLLSSAERAVFRRLGVFPATFDVAAAVAVATGGRVERGDVVELVASLVDKSLVVRLDVAGRTRYRLLETIRHFAAARLDAAGESDDARRRLAEHVRQVVIDRGGDIELATEHENARAAFEWSVEHGDATTALLLPTVLGPAWLRHGWLAEGLRWLRTALAIDGDVDPALRARALALAATWGGNYGENPAARDQGDEALAIARELGDVDALKAALSGAARARYQTEPYTAIPYDTELLEVARRDGDVHHAALASAGIGLALLIGGDPTSALPYVEEAEIALRHTPYVADWTQTQGVMATVLVGIGRLDDARAVVASTIPRTTDGEPGRWLLQFAGACVAATSGYVDEADQWAADLTAAGMQLGLTQPLSLGHLSAGLAAMARGDAIRAREELEASLATVEDVEHSPSPYAVQTLAPLAEMALRCSDLGAARRYAQLALAQAASYPSHRASALTAHARVAAAGGDVRGAMTEALEALDLRHRLSDLVGFADSLEVIVGLSIDDRVAQDDVPPMLADHAARLLAVAGRIREETGARRPAVHDAPIERVRDVLVTVLGDDGVDQAAARGAAMPTPDAVALAHRRRRGPHASFGWDSLTPAETEVVRLIGDGLSNKEIAARLHLSARTVQSHLSHVYRKLDVRSRLELARDLSVRDS